jgi:phosphoglycerate kinase
VSGAQIYVNDAFGAAHRAHSSTHGITKFVQHKVSGILLDKELSALGKIMTSPEHPVVACIGGSKVSTKLPVLESLLKKCDTILIGGGMMFTFSKAMVRARTIAIDAVAPTELAGCVAA